MQYPDAVDPGLVGTYPAAAFAGGGYVWDAVLEYRVWCHLVDGALDAAYGEDYFICFATYREALECSRTTRGAEEPVALVLQEEYLDEPEPGRYTHVKLRRVTEWPATFLARPRRTTETIPAFLAPDAPANRLDVIRGLEKRLGPSGRPKGKRRRTEE